ncbi:MAG: XRE family transcriptional regulator [Bacillota bacterium]|nr:XRE family transcriptional regulator [Bacillota bacterium]MCL5779625.1 XRE family transcriptional regulator [Bacillota bacterium]
MTNTQKIKMALAFIGKSEAWLAKEIGSTPQAFNQRMKTDKFSTVELEGIAKALGAVYSSFFEFPDGTKI